MSGEVVRFAQVWKAFGEHAALAGFSCHVPAGSVSALLGRNGAGKTTALRCLMGLLRFDRGRIELFGREDGPADAQVRQRIGYVSERLSLDPRLTVGQTLDFASSFHATWDGRLARSLLDRLDLSPHTPVASLSLGQGRKLALLLNLAFRPALLILDEPAANLDAVVRREFLEAVLEMLRDEGITVLLSTHLLADVERIADRVILLERGALRVEASLDELKERVKGIRLLPANGTALPDLQVDGLLRRRRVGDEVQLFVDNYRPGLEHALAGRCGARAAVMDLPLEEIFIAYESSAPQRSLNP